MSRARVVIELGNGAQSSGALAAGGVFVPGCALRLSEECDLVVCGATHQLVIPARVVYVDEQRGGAGLELIGFSSELKDQLAELDLEASHAGGVAIVEDLPPLDDDATEPVALSLELDLIDPLESLESLEPPDEPSEPLAAGTQDPSRPSRRGGPAHERLRGLTLGAQLKLAATGELQERILLERFYGKNVWETLLRNPRLSPPEVARIARYGTLPRILLELIVSNNAWLQVPEIRRALLSNPRLGTDQIMKVLRLTPKHELKLAAVQAAYPHTVRSAAKMLLRDS